MNRLLFIAYLLIEKKKGLGLAKSYKRFQSIYLRSPYGYLSFLDYWCYEPDLYICKVTKSLVRSSCIKRKENVLTNIIINNGRIAFLKKWWQLRHVRYLSD